MCLGACLTGNQPTICKQLMHISHAMGKHLFLGSFLIEQADVSVGRSASAMTLGRQSVSVNCCKKLEENLFCTQRYLGFLHHTRCFVHFATGASGTLSSRNRCMSTFSIHDHRTFDCSLPL